MAAAENKPRNFGAIDDEEDEDEDEAMADAPTEDQEQENKVEDAEAEAQDAKDDEEFKAEAVPEEDDEPPKSPTPPPEPVIRRRRLGRPPKNRPPDWDTLPIEPPSGDTPRRRGRGGWRGRGGRRGQHLQPTTQSIDKDGTVVKVVNDELDLPEDPEGETKIDRMGRLQGGRDYRCRTFTVAGRGERLYMLSTEPARCVGFRDSYLFFNKHRKLYKILVNDEEKKDMIEREIIPHSYKGRTIGIVTARSVFREFGALIIIAGRKVVDDYDVAKVREEGAVEGELADPTDVYESDKPYNKNQFVAWFGASSVYHTNHPQAPVPKAADPRRRRAAVNNMNWMLEHARAAGSYNAMLSQFRLANSKGAYDIHTNQMFYPAHMQPTRARFEQVSSITNEDNDDDCKSVSTSKFPPVPSLLSRNYLVTDFHMETPPSGIASVAYNTFLSSGMADGDFLTSFGGLSVVPDDIKELLPPECRESFDAALAQEEAFKARWGTEAGTGGRRDPLVDKAIVPYSVALS